MSNPTGPDQPKDATGPEDGTDTGAAADEATVSPDQESDAETEVLPEPDPEHEPATEILGLTDAPAQDPAGPSGERRFTAPSGFDAGSTQIINRPVDPPTEAFPAAFSTGKPTGPQMIPPRGEVPKPPRKRRSWGWAIAIVLVIAALAAVAILGTLLLTRNSGPAISREDMVRSTIEEFDTAVQSGDLSTLRDITCGETRADYADVDDKTWTDTHARVSAAKRYPVVASIDQVVINGDHAEANVTTFMAYDPQTRSTRSFDLQYREDRWKICQAPVN